MEFLSEPRLLAKYRVQKREMNQKLHPKDVDADIATLFIGWGLLAIIGIVFLVGDEHLKSVAKSLALLVFALGTLIPEFALGTIVILVCALLSVVEFAMRHFEKGPK